MGTYFLMSKRFNKTSASDFGLVESKNDNLAFDLKTGEMWKKCPLFDFGWGCENGYCKLPIPNFRDLLRILLMENNSNDDIYGAAAIILKNRSIVK